MLFPFILLIIFLLYSLLISRLTDSLLNWIIIQIQKVKYEETTHIEVRDNKFKVFSL